MSTSKKLAAALSRWLQEERERRAAQVLDGVPIDAYRERIAYIKALGDVAAELPRIMKDLDES
ncbi:MAG: hypothetical protein RIS17_465 [Pseudomonadota bacterium]